MIIPIDLLNRVITFVRVKRAIEFFVIFTLKTKLNYIETPFSI